MDGRVLIAGGRNSGGVTDGVESLDPGGGSSALPSLLTGRADHTATRLKNGQVLLTGGTLAGGSATAFAEIFDPISDTWTPLQMGYARSHHTATLLRDGRVLIAGGEAGGAPSATIEIFDPDQWYMQFTKEVRESGHYQAGAPLQATSTATSVRVRNGKRAVTDGPFAETREQLGGYYLVEAKDLDEAISIAARIPSARLGTIEVRPVMEMSMTAAS